MSETTSSDVPLVGPTTTADRNAGRRRERGGAIIAPSTRLPCRGCLLWTRQALLLAVLLLPRCGREEQARIDPQVAELPLADYETPIGPVPDEVHEYHVAEIRRNDSLSTALMRLGVGAFEVDEIVQSLKGIFDFRHARSGDVIEIRRDSARKLSWFRYTSGPATIAVAFRGSDGAMRGMLEPVHVVTSTAVVEGRVQYSLYEAMEQAGEHPALTLQFVDLFAWDVDFVTETQTGDSFRIIVEKKILDGRMISYGSVLGLEYAMVDGRVHRAFLFRHKNGQVGYYTDKGLSVRKAFLKSPIQFASITSRYGMRRHPILKYVRAHRGVDYGAPAGTAVWAVGDGVVRLAGRQGGYGNLVQIRHANGLETRYAHLRAFASGIRTGGRISQKQVIGYVGSTGLATGPHLHFEVLRNGRYANPLSVTVPPAPPILEGEREAFMSAIAPMVRQMDEARRAAFAQATVTVTATVAVE